MKTLLKLTIICHMASGHNETWQNDPSGFEMNVGLNDPGRVVKDKMVIPYELSLLENRAGRHILDLGSGNGEYTQAFIDKGATVVGLDISRKQTVTASNN